MKKISLYVSAMRLRTLPLSLAGVILGLLLAAADYHVGWPVVVFMLLTTACLQILSNVSNELGDAMRGTGSGQGRESSEALLRGELGIGEMKVMTGVFVLSCLVFGACMIYFSFGTLLCLEALMMMLMGVSAISAAMRYTLGRNPYGYRGLGDIYVFMFFGVVAVLGSYFVASHTLHWKMLLPAVSLGAFSVGVLNVNNIRDMESDASVRVTTALKMGERNAKIYQTVLVVIGWAAMFLYSSLRFFDPWHYLFAATLPLFAIHLSGVWKRTGKDLDPMLPLLVISSFLFAVAGGLGYVVYLF